VRIVDAARRPATRGFSLRLRRLFSYHETNVYRQAVVMPPVSKVETH